MAGYVELIKKIPFKGILGVIPKFFAFFFVFFVITSTLSDGWNESIETGEPIEFIKSIAVATVKPIISADFMIEENVNKFKEKLSITKIMLGWANIIGALFVLYYMYKRFFIVFDSLFTLTSPMIVHLIVSLVIVLMITLYNTVASGSLMIGGNGLYTLFTNFDLVFGPVINLSNTIMGTG